MKIDELINVVTNICQLVDGWTAGNCSCGAPVPWSKWDEETRQSAHKLLADLYAHKEGRAKLIDETLVPSNGLDVPCKNTNCPVYSIGCYVSSDKCKMRK